MLDFYETRDQFLSDFVSENPQFSSVGPKTLYSSLVYSQPTVRDMISGSPAPDYSSPEELADGFRKFDPDRFGAASNDDILARFADENPLLAGAWGLGAADDPGRKVATSEPDADEEEVEPARDDFERMFGDWYGRRPAKPLEEYKLGSELLDLGKKNLEGSQGFWEAFRGHQGVGGFVPYLADALDAVEIGKILLIGQRLKDGKDDDVTDDELVRFNYYMQRLKREDEGGWKAMAGAISRTSILFGLEMGAAMATFGWGLGGSAAAKAAKKAGQEGAEEVVEQVARAAVKETTKKAQKRLGRNVADDVGERTLKELWEDSAKHAGRAMSELPYLGSDLSKYTLLSGKKAAATRSLYKTLGEEVNKEIAVRLGGGRMAKIAGASAGFLADTMPLAGINLAGKTVMDATLTTALSGEPGTSAMARRRLQAMLSGQDDPMLAGSLADMFIEYASEMSGEYLTDMLGLGIGKVAGAVASKGMHIPGEVLKAQGPTRAIGARIASRLRAAAEAGGDGKPAFDRAVGKMAHYMSTVGRFGGRVLDEKTMSGELAAMLKTHGYNGVAGEWLEERFGGFLRGVTGLEGDEHKSYMRNVLESTMPKNSDQFVAELVAFSLPSAMMAGGQVTGRLVGGRTDPLYSSYRAMRNAVETGNITGLMPPEEAKKFEVKQPGEQEAKGKASASPLFKDRDALVEGARNILRVNAAENLSHSGSVAGTLLDAMNWVVGKATGLTYINQTDAGNLKLPKPGLYLSSQSAAARAGAVGIVHGGLTAFQDRQKKKDRAGTVGLPEGATPAEIELRRQILRQKDENDAAELMANQILGQNRLFAIRGKLTAAERELAENGGGVPFTPERQKQLEDELGEKFGSPEFAATMRWDPISRTANLTPESLLFLNDPYAATVAMIRGAAFEFDLGDKRIMSTAATLRTSLIEAVRSGKLTQPQGEAAASLLGILERTGGDIAADAAEAAAAKKEIAAAKAAVPPEGESAGAKAARERKVSDLEARVAELESAERAETPNVRAMLSASAAREWSEVVEPGSLAGQQLGWRERTQALREALAAANDPVAAMDAFHAFQTLLVPGLVQGSAMVDFDAAENLPDVTESTDPYTVIVSMLRRKGIPNQVKQLAMRRHGFDPTSRYHVQEFDRLIDQYAAIVESLSRPGTSVGQIVHSVGDAAMDEWVVQETGNPNVPSSQRSITLRRRRDGKIDSVGADAVATRYVAKADPIKYLGIVLHDNVISATRAELELLWPSSYGYITSGAKDGKTPFLVRQGEKEVDGKIVADPSKDVFRFSQAAVNTGDALIVSLFGRHPVEDALENVSKRLNVAEILIRRELEARVKSLEAGRPVGWEKSVAELRSRISELASSVMEVPKWFVAEMECVLSQYEPDPANPKKEVRKKDEKSGLYDVLKEAVANRGSTDTLWEIYHKLNLRHKRGWARQLDGSGRPVGGVLSDVVDDLAFALGDQRLNASDGVFAMQDARFLEAVSELNLRQYDFDAVADHPIGKPERFRGRNAAKTDIPVLIVTKSGSGYTARFGQAIKLEDKATGEVEYSVAPYVASGKTLGLMPGDAITVKKGSPNIRLFDLSAGSSETSRTYGNWHSALRKLGNAFGAAKKERDKLAAAASSVRAKKLAELGKIVKERKAEEAKAKEAWDAAAPEAEAAAGRAHLAAQNAAVRAEAELNELKQSPLENDAMRALDVEMAAGMNTAVSEYLSKLKVSFSSADGAEGIMQRLAKLDGTDPSDQSPDDFDVDVEDDIPMGNEENNQPPPPPPPPSGGANAPGGVNTSAMRSLFGSRANRSLEKPGAQETKKLGDDIMKRIGHAEGAEPESFSLEEITYELVPGSETSTFGKVYKVLKNGKDTGAVVPEEEVLRATSAAAKPAAKAGEFTASGAFIPAPTELTAEQIAARKESFRAAAEAARAAAAAKKSAPAPSPYVAQTSTPAAPAAPAAAATEEQVKDAMARAQALDDGALEALADAQSRLTSIAVAGSPGVRTGIVRMAGIVGTLSGFGMFDLSDVFVDAARREKILAASARTLVALNAGKEAPGDAAVELASMIYALLTHEKFADFRQNGLGMFEQPEPGDALAAAAIFAGLPYRDGGSGVAEYLKNFSAEMLDGPAAYMYPDNLERFMELYAREARRSSAATMQQGSEREDARAKTMEEALLDYAKRLAFGADHAAVIPGVLEEMSPLVDWDGNQGRRHSDPWHDEDDFNALVDASTQWLADVYEGKASAVGSVDVRFGAGRTVALPASAMRYWLGAAMSGLSHQGWREDVSTRQSKVFIEVARVSFGEDAGKETVGVAYLGEPGFAPLRLVRALNANRMAALKDVLSPIKKEDLYPRAFAVLHTNIGRNETYQNKESDRLEMSNAVDRAVDVVARALERSGEFGEAGALRALAERIKTAPLADLRAASLDALNSLLAAFSAKDRFPTRPDVAAKAFLYESWKTPYAGYLDAVEANEEKSDLAGAPRGQAYLGELLRKLYAQAPSQARYESGKRERSIDFLPHAYRLVQRLHPDLLLSGPGLPSLFKLGEVSGEKGAREFMSLQHEARVKRIEHLIRSGNDVVTYVPIPMVDRTSVPFVVQMSTKALDKELDSFISGIREDLKRAVADGSPDWWKNQLTDTLALLEKRDAWAHWMVGDAMLGIDSFGRTAMERVHASVGGQKRKVHESGRGAALSGSARVPVLLIQKNGLFEIVGGERVPLEGTASDGFGAHAADMFKDLGLGSGDAAKFQVLGAVESKWPGPSVSVAKPATLPLSTMVAQLELAAKASGESKNPGNLETPAWAGGASSMFVGLSRAAEADPTLGKADFLLDSGATKEVNVELGDDPGGTPVVLRYKSGGREFEVSVRMGWTERRNVMRTAVIAGESTEGEMVAGVSAIPNLYPVAPERMERVASLLHVAMSQLKNDPGLQARYEQAVIEAARKSSFDVGRLASVRASQNPFLEGGIGARKLVREAGQLDIDTLYNLIVSPMESPERTRVGRGTSPLLRAGGKGRPALMQVNDYSRGAAFALYFNAEFHEKFKTEAEKRTAIREFFLEASQVSGDREFGARVRRKKNETDEALLSREVRAVAEQSVLARLIDFADAYIRDYTGVQGMTFMEDLGGLIDHNGAFREEAITTIGGLLAVTPMLNMTERFPGATKLMSRTAGAVSAPASSELRKMPVRQKDGSWKSMQRIGSAREAYMILDAATMARHGIDSDADKGAVRKLVKPRGPVVSVEELATKAAAGPLSKIDMAWLRYYVMSEFYGAMNDLAETEHDKSIDADYAAEAKVTPIEVVRRYLPADALDGDGRTTISRINDMELHFMSSAAPAMWRFLTLAAMKAGDRGHIVTAHDGLGYIAGENLRISGTGGNLGQTSRGGVLSPDRVQIYGHVYNGRPDGWRAAGDTAHAAEIRLRSLESALNEMNHTIDQVKKVGGRHAGIDADTSPMYVAHLAGYEFKYTKADENVVRDRLAREAAEWDGLSDEQKKTAPKPQSFDDWARSTPGTELHALQSWIDFTERHDGMKLLLRAATLSGESESARPQSWEEYVPPLFKAVRETDEKFRTMSDDALMPELVARGVFGDQGVEGLFRTGDEIRRIGGILKQYHNLSWKPEETLRFLNDVRGVLETGRGQPDAGVPVFMHVGVNRMRDSEILKLNQTAGRILDALVLGTGAASNRTVRKALEEMIREKKFRSEFDRVYDNVDRSVFSGAVVRAYPELRVFLDRLAKLYDAPDSSPEVQAAVAARVKQNLADAQGKATEEDRVKALGILDAFAEDMALEDTQAIAITAENAARAVLVHAASNADELAEAVPEWSDEEKSYYAALVRDSVMTKPRAKLRKGDARIGSARPKNLLVGVSVDPSFAGIERFREFLYASTRMLAAGVEVSIPRVRYVSKEQLEAAEVKSAKSGKLKLEGVAPEVLESLKETTILSRRIAPGAKVRVEGSEIIPLLAFLGASEHGTSIDRNNGNPLSSFPTAELRRIFDAYSAELAEQSTAADPGKKFSAEQRMRLVVNHARRQDTGKGRALDEKIGARSWAPVPSYMIGMVPIVRYADLADHGKRKTVALSEVGQESNSLAEIVARANFAETGATKDGKAARPYPQWASEALERLDHDLRQGFADAITDRRMADVASMLRRTGRPDTAAALEKGYRNAVNSIIPRARALSPAESKALTYSQPLDVARELQALENNPNRSHAEEARLAKLKEYSVRPGAVRRLETVVRNGKDVLADAAGAARDAIKEKLGPERAALVDGGAGISSPVYARAVSLVALDAESNGTGGVKGWVLDQVVEVADTLGAALEDDGGGPTAANAILDLLRKDRIKGIAPRIVESFQDVLDTDVADLVRGQRAEAAAYGEAAVASVVGVPAAAEDYADAEYGEETHSLVGYNEILANYAASRLAVGGIDELHRGLMDLMNRQSGWDRRLNMTFLARARYFGHDRNRNEVKRMAVNKKDSEKASKKAGHAVVLKDYRDGILDRKSTNTAKKTKLQINQQTLVDYILTALVQGKEWLAVGTRKWRGVVVDPDGNPTEFVWVLRRSFTRLGEKKELEAGQAMSGDSASQLIDQAILHHRAADNEETRAKMWKLYFGETTKAASAKKQINDIDAATGEILSPFVSLDYAAGAWEGSSLQALLVEYGREKSWVDLRRDSRTGEWTGGLVDVANEIKEVARDAYNDYLDISNLYGMHPGESLVGFVEGYLPQIYGGSGFETAEHHLAKDLVHRMARLRGNRTGANTELPPEAYRVKFTDAGTSDKEPLSAQVALFDKISDEIDAAVQRRGDVPPKLKVAMAEKRKEWDRAQYNYNLLNLATRLETELAVEAEAAGTTYRMRDGKGTDESGAREPDRASLINGLKRTTQQYSAREWSPRTGPRKYKSYFDALVESGGENIMSITDPFRLVEKSVVDVMATLPRAILVNRFALSNDGEGNPFVIIVPRIGEKSKSPDEQFKDGGSRNVQSMVWDDTFRRQVEMLEIRSGKKAKGETPQEQLIDLVFHQKAVSSALYDVVGSDYQSVDHFLVLKRDTFGGRPGKSRVNKLFRQVADRPWQYAKDIDGYEHDLLRVLSRANQFMKHMSLGWSLFFATAGLESAIAGTPLHKNIAYFWTPRAWAAYRQIAETGRALRRGDISLAKKLQEYHRAGFVISERNISDGSSTVVDEIIDGLSDAARQRWGEGGAARTRFAMRFLTGRKLSEWLMGDFFGGLKLWAADSLVAELQAQNPHLPRSAVLRMAAPIVNDAYGGQNWHRYYWATPKTMQLLNLLMFAPNWTISAWNIAGGGLITGNVLENYMSPENVKFVASNWVSMYLIALQAIPNLMQAAIYAAAGDGDDESFDDKMFAWQNETGKGGFFPSIDITPLARRMPGYSGEPTGRRRIYMRFGKQSYEVINGWLTDPGATLGRKSSMIVKAAWEQAFGYSPGSPDFALPFRGAGLIGLVDSSIGFRGSRVGTLLSKVLPMSWSSWVSNPDAALISFLAPAAKGMSQTKAVQGMVAVLAAYAESGPKGRFKYRPDQRANLHALSTRYVDALKRNGYDPDQVITAAKGKVMPALYADFYDAFSRKDEVGMEDASVKILRVGGTSAGLLRSVAQRQTKTGRPELTEEQKLAVREAFRDAMPPFVEAYLGDI